MSIVVVSDTSPLNYLIQIKLSEVLRRIYDRVLIPGAVLQELEHTESPLLVRAWLLDIPTWIECKMFNPAQTQLWITSIREKVGDSTGPGHPS